MAEKRKYEVIVYAKGRSGSRMCKECGEMAEKGDRRCENCGSIDFDTGILYKAYLWAYSRRQAERMIKVRLRKENNMEKLYLFENDYPFSITDITDREDPDSNILADIAEEIDREKAEKEQAGEKYNTCPECGSEANSDYCPACGWQRFAHTGWYGKRLSGTGFEASVAEE